MSEERCEVLIVGGGIGGCAAALAASSMGAEVVLTEQFEWVGGQLTSQAVPPDEQPWIEEFGCTASYRRYRDNVRQHYRDHYPLTSKARNDPRLNPGEGWVSRLCHEPRVALAVLNGMLEEARASGARLKELARHRPVACDVDGDRIRAVRLFDEVSGKEKTISAKVVLDATETGELLPLSGVEYVVGSEAQSETQEPHATENAEPENVQGFTWCFAMAYDPAGDHTIERPTQYSRWRDFRPEFWPGPLLGWETSHPITHEVKRWPLFADERSLGLFEYRRILCNENFDGNNARFPYAEWAGIGHPHPDPLPRGRGNPFPHEVTIVNWPQNDYFLGTILDVEPEIAAQRLEDSRQLSLSLLYWLQSEAPREEKGVGYSGLYLRPDIAGTADGLCMAPYIRESRRIRAQFTVCEQHVAADCNPGKSVAPDFFDSVGIGAYRIDLHPSSNGRNSIDIASLPFQIPLGALIPIRMDNLLAACKNIGTTHITNGCYRLHPVEWNIGEAAGALAAFCIEKKVEPRQVREKRELLSEFQGLLENQGVELAWPQGVHAL